MTDELVAAALAVLDTADTPVFPLRAIADSQGAIGRLRERARAEFSRMCAETHIPDLAGCRTPEEARVLCANHLAFAVLAIDATLLNYAFLRVLCSALPNMRCQVTSNLSTANGVFFVAYYPDLALLFPTPTADARVCGCECVDLLDAIMRTMEHAIAHIMVFKNWSSVEESHGPEFRAVAALLFGHADTCLTPCTGVQTLPYPAPEVSDAVLTLVRE